MQQAQQQRRRPQHTPGICNHGVSIVCEGRGIPLTGVASRPLLALRGLGVECFITYMVMDGITRGKKV